MNKNIITKQKIVFLNNKILENISSRFNLRKNLNIFFENKKRHRISILCVLKI
jgi:hypothetical protein